jgi:hypothetical protein
MSAAGVHEAWVSKSPCPGDHRYAMYEPSFALVLKEECNALPKPRYKKLKHTKDIMNLLSACLVLKADALFHNHPTDPRTSATGDSQFLCWKGNQIFLQPKLTKQVSFMEMNDG